MKLRYPLVVSALASLLTAAPAEVRDLGIPVKGVSWARLHPGRTAEGHASLLASMSQNNGGLFVLDIDLATGHCRQFPVHDGVNSTFSAASFRSLLTGILYVVSGWDGHLHRYDANHPELGLQDLGRIYAAPGDIAPLGINEGPDGVLWIGTYPGASLTKYDPASGQFTHFGKFDATDNYLYPLAGDDGSLAAIVKFGRQHLLVIDPRTGEHREVGPSVTDAADKAQFLKFFKGADRRLYLDSHAGKFRVDGMNLTPVDELPAPLAGIHATYKHAYQAPAEMPGGWTAHFLDDNINGTGTPRNVLLVNRDPSVASRRLHLDWIGGGSNLHTIDVGPGGELYGSSYMPNRLYRASLDGARIEDLGEHTFAGGEAYSTVTLDGKLYLGSYPESRLSVYDPSKPLHFGAGPNDNPRDLGRLDGIGYRPNVLLATPDGRLWMGSSPDYGLYGGTLAWYDPKTGAKKSHRVVVPDLSPASGLYLPELKQILLGLSIETGTGMPVKKDVLHGAFALWDPAEDKLIWSGDLGLDNLADVSSLAPAGNGLVYALLGRGDHILSAGAPEIGPRLALIDPAKRTVVASAWLPADYGPLSWHGYFSLRVGPGGAVYGATGYCVFRIKPGTCDVERVWQLDQPKKRPGTVWLTASSPNVIDVVGPIVGNTFYFATGWRLRALTLP
ncbi:MAG: hypothetical protein JSS11_10310 [Verrucomicrobia bacterium]|nr:hypothetical protein [Verrucomicrobiota bacterium]